MRFAMVFASHHVCRFLKLDSHLPLMLIGQALARRKRFARLPWGMGPLPFCTRPRRAQRDLVHRDFPLVGAIRAGPCNATQHIEANVGGSADAEL